MSNAYNDLCEAFSRMESKYSECVLISRNAIVEITNELREYMNAPKIVPEPPAYSPISFSKVNSNGRIETNSLPENLTDGGMDFYIVFTTRSSTSKHLINFTARGNIKLYNNETGVISFQGDNANLYSLKIYENKIELDDKLLPKIVELLGSKMKDTPYLSEQHDSNNR